MLLTRLAAVALAIDISANFLFSSSRSTCIMGVESTETEERGFNNIHHVFEALNLFLTKVCAEIQPPGSGRFLALLAVTDYHHIM